MNSRIVRRLTFSLVVAFALVWSACDSTNISPEDGSDRSPVSVSFAAKVAPNAGKAGANVITDEQGNAIELSSVQVLLRDVKFKSPDDGSDDEREVNVGPLLIDIPLDSIPEVQFETELPRGVWEEIELEIDERRDSDEIDFPRGVSIRVTGAWTPLGGPSTAFTFESDVEGEREIELDPPLKIEESRPYNVTLMVDIDKWFRQSTGTLVNPSTANDGGANEDLVEDNIEDSFEGFEDDDRDGDDDGDEDEYRSGKVEVEGPIQSLTDSTITVSDRTFRVNASTNVKGDDNQPIEFSDLATGDVVEVMGTYNDEDELIARKIEVEDDGSSDDGRDEVERRGRIQALSVDDSTLTVSGHTFTVTKDTEIKGDDDQPLSLDDLREGDFVEVEGHYTDDGTLVADEIERDFPGDDNGDDDEVEVKGPIDAIYPDSLTVSGKTFVVNEDTEVKGDDDASLNYSDLEVGDRVEVEGYYDEDDVLIAKEIEREDSAGRDDDDDEVEIKGSIDAISESEITVSDTSFAITDRTRIFGDDDEPISVDDLAVGDVVEVEGYYDEDDVLIAKEIELESETDADEAREVEVEGPIQRLTETTLTVKGRTFTVTENTKVEGDDDDSLTFADLEEGDYVEVEGFYNEDDVLVAKTIERDDD